MKTDVQLRADVMSELAWDPLIDAKNVLVDVKDGVVTLTADLDNCADKHAIGRAMARVAGTLEGERGKVRVIDAAEARRRRGVASGAMADLCCTMNSWARRSAVD
jgi:hypothetical protein